MLHVFAGSHQFQKLEALDCLEYLIDICDVDQLTEETVVRHDTHTCSIAAALQQRRAHNKSCPAALTLTGRADPT